MYFILPILSTFSSYHTHPLLPSDKLWNNLKTYLQNQKRMRRKMFIIIMQMMLMRVNKNCISGLGRRAGEFVKRTNEDCIDFTQLFLFTFFLTEALFGFPSLKKNNKD